jgi:hypothetical protein
VVFGHGDRYGSLRATRVCAGRWFARGRSSATGGNPSTSNRAAARWKVSYQAQPLEDCQWWHHAGSKIAELPKDAHRPALDVVMELSLCARHWLLSIDAIVNPLSLALAADWVATHTIGARITAALAQVLPDVPMPTAASASLVIAQACLCCACRTAGLCGTVWRHTSLVIRAGRSRDRQSPPSHRDVTVSSAAPGQLINQVEMVQRPALRSEACNRSPRRVVHRSRSIPSTVLRKMIEPGVRMIAVRAP